jgi:glucosamine 6-phosphate synthetase-like amidotransferase/phosphosugar isomerase protein
MFSEKVHSIFPMRDLGEFVMAATIAEQNDILRKHMLSLADPKAWEKTMALTSKSLKTFENKPFLKEVKQVILIGHGTSYATSLNIESFIAHIADCRAVAMPAFHFAGYAADYIKNPGETLVIGVSCSGNTASVTDGLKTAERHGAATMIISGEGDIEAAKIALYRIMADTLLERKVNTSAYSVSHLFLSLAGYELAILMGQKNGALDASKAQYWRAQFKAVQAALVVLPSLFDQMKEVSVEFSSSTIRNLCVLGTGPNIGTMKEGALKISEFCWLFCAGEELEDFAHGRFREVDASVPLFIIAPNGHAIAKTMDLLTGCSVSKTPSVIFTDAPTVAMKKLATRIIEMPKVESEYLTSFLYVFPLWFYGWHIMNANGGLVGDKRHGLFAKDINFKLYFDEEGNEKIP